MSIAIKLCSWFPCSASVSIIALDPGKLLGPGCCLYLRFYISGRKNPRSLPLFSSKACGFLLIALNDRSAPSCSDRSSGLGLKLAKEPSLFFIWIQRMYHAPRNLPVPAQIFIVPLGHECTIMCLIGMFGSFQPITWFLAAYNENYTYI